MTASWLCRRTVPSCRSFAARLVEACPPCLSLSHHMQIHGIVKLLGRFRRKLAYNVLLTHVLLYHGKLGVLTFCNTCSSARNKPYLRALLARRTRTGVSYSTVFMCSECYPRLSSSSLRVLTIVYETLEQRDQNALTPRTYTLLCDQQQTIMLSSP